MTVVEPESFLPRFQLSSFRPGQREVITTLLSGEDCLCVMPTGGGKSLCYQLPALAAEGVTLVVSPLIALMQDQVDALQRLGIQATFINSSLDPAEQSRRLEAMAAGAYDLVYVVPERFRSPRFMRAISQVKLAALAVDEAHCISEWGHDFRPDYARLGEVRERLGYPRTIALTATATKAVRADICRLLQLNDPRVFITGFARENLFYRVETPSNAGQKDTLLLEFLASHPGTGIVYAATRKRCEEVVNIIRSQSNRTARAYHAGLEPAERRAAQHAFMSGQTEVIVATTAFGMGIDKSNVRFVIHYNLPGTLEGYYQEAGRAGRDGKRSECLLLYSAGDRYIQEFFIENAYPAPEIIRAVYEFLCQQRADPIELTQEEIKNALALPVGGEAIGKCEQLLERAGVLKRLDTMQNMAAVCINSDLPTVLDLVPSTSRNRRRLLQTIEQIIGDQRGEYVFVHPQQLVDRSELDSQTVTRTLRELRELDCFDYVPPFRGRAIRMLERTRRFEQLDIDLTAYQQRKDAEYEKLGRVVSFARSKQCRQQIILDYFGDSQPASCGHCDNCGQSATSVMAPPDSKTAAAVRSVLETMDRVDSRFGKGLITRILCGSQSAQLLRLKLDRLTTFGSLQGMRQTDVSELIDSLLVAGLLNQTELEPNRPVLHLTDLGRRIHADPQAELPELPLPSRLAAKLTGVSVATSSPTGNTSPQTAAQAGPQSTALPAATGPLTDQLRRWRREQADSAGIPAFRILTNATLEDLIQSRPMTLAELEQVKGIGPAKIRLYGEPLLEILRAASSPQPTGMAGSGPTTSGTASRQTTTTISREDHPPRVASETSRGDRGTVYADSSVALAISHSAAPPTDPPPATEASTPEPAARFPQPPLPPEAPALPGSVTAMPAANRPAHYWTWRLLQAGLACEEVAAARNISRHTVVEHLIRAAGDGLPLRGEWIFSPEQYRQLDELIGPQRPESIRRLLPQLPSGTRYEEVQLFLLARGQRAPGRQTSLFDGG